MIEKLDRITIDQLGIPFDEEAIWTRLDARLNNKQAYDYPWFLAACFFVLVLFFPMTLLKDTVKEEMPITITREVPLAPITTQEVTTTKEIQPSAEIKILQPRMTVVSLAQVNKGFIHQLPIEKPENIATQPQFALEDISIIQASLKQSSIEKGKSLTVRAQLQSFSTSSETSNTQLKIKLYEKHE